MGRFDLHRALCQSLCRESGERWPGIGPPCNHVRFRAMSDLDDVVAMAMPVLAHRVVLNFQAEAEGVSAAKVVAGLPKP